MSLRLYGRSSSYNVQKVLWLLDELRLDVEHIEYGGRFQSLDTDEFFKINPFRKIPVLFDNKKSIRESNSILRYLAARYGQQHWWANDPYQRSIYESWMDWSIDVVEPAFVGVFWGYYRTPEANRDWTHINLHREKCIDCLDMIDLQTTQTSYLAGSDISLADISVAVFIYRLCEIDLGIDLPPATRRWYKQLTERAGYQNWVMSDFSELKGRQTY